jgi:hypothetical protein
MTARAAPVMTARARIGDDGPGRASVMTARARIRDDRPVPASVMTAAMKRARTLKTW